LASYLSKVAYFALHVHLVTLLDDPIGSSQRYLMLKNLSP